ncbi:hypothetical protein LINPERHAP1_LOCUS20371 [Linum perenne]
MRRGFETPRQSYRRIWSRLGSDKGYKWKTKPRPARRSTALLASL